MDEWFLGIDAGGSSTVAALWNPGLNRGFVAEAGPGNPSTYGIDVALQAVTDSTVFACGKAEIHPNQISAAALGIAGAGDWEIREQMKSAINAWGLQSHCRWFTDLEIAASASIKGGRGIHVVAGTGSGVIAKSESGPLTQIGGLGWFLDDKGSGFDIGKRAIRRHLQISQGTQLRRPIDDLLQSAFNDNALLSNAIRAPGEYRTWISSLAKMILDEATRGDETAVEILDQSIEGIVLHVRRGWEILSCPTQTAIGLSGSVAIQPIYQKSLESKLLQMGLTAPVFIRVTAPVQGALIEAAASAGKTLRSFPQEFSELLRRGA